MHGTDHFAEALRHAPVRELQATLVSPGAVAGVEGFAHLGLPENLALGLGMLEIACTVVYVIPQTSVLGAILLTGYLGGATVTHLRVSDPYFMPVLVGVLVWGGIFLRDPRLRALIPLRREPMVRPAVAQMRPLKWKSKSTT